MYGATIFLEQINRFKYNARYLYLVSFVFIIFINRRLYSFFNTNLREFLLSGEFNSKTEEGKQKHGTIIKSIIIYIISFSHHGSNIPRHFLFLKRWLVAMTELLRSGKQNLNRNICFFKIDDTAYIIICMKNIVFVPEKKSNVYERLFYDFDHCVI